MCLRGIILLLKQIYKVHKLYFSEVRLDVKHWCCVCILKWQVNKHLCTIVYKQVQYTYNCKCIKLLHKIPGFITKGPPPHWPTFQQADFVEKESHPRFLLGGGGLKGVSGGRAHLPITQQIGVYKESKESHKRKKSKPGINCSKARWNR